MDTSEKVGISISMIEQYIEERHKYDPDLIPGVSTTPPELHFGFHQGIKFGYVISLGKSRI